MTLDYPEDLAFFEAVIDAVDEPHALEDVVALLRARPDIVAINAGRQAEYWERFHARYPPVELA
jgi:spore coat polysaccharide biosynthesis protein SpsF (cytidylyltransferase family)